MFTNEDFRFFLAKNCKVDFELIASYYKESNDPFVVAKRLMIEEKISSEKLGKIYGSYINFAYVNPNETIVDEYYSDLLGTAFISAYRCIPLCKFGKAVTVTTSNPLNPYLQDRLEKKLESIVSLVFCFPFDVEDYMIKNGIN